MPTKASNNATPLLLVDKATTNNTLQPMDVLKGTDVVLKWPPLSTLHTVELSWFGPTTAGQQKFTVQGSNTGEVRVAIAKNLIGACIGHTVFITAEVKLNGQAVADAALDLQIEVIHPSDMPAPRYMNLSEENNVLWLDMRKFFGDADVELDAPPFIAEGQRMSWEAVGQEHTPRYTFYSIMKNHIVTKDEAEPGYVFRKTIPRAWINRNSDYTSATQEASFIFSGAPPSSPLDPTKSQLPGNGHEAQKTTCNLRVGDPDLILTPPFVPEAKPGGYLDPVDVPEGATVCATVEGMLGSDNICFFLEGAPGDGKVPLGCINGSESGTVCRPMPLSDIITNIGKDITLSYTLKREDDTLNSLTLDLTILSLVWPEPRLLEAQDGYYDPSAADCGATVRVAIWPLAKVGQAIWGLLENLQDNTLTWISPGTLLTQKELDQGFIERTVDPNFLKQLPDNRLLEIKVSVNFDKLNTRPTSTLFPIGQVKTRQMYAVSRTVLITGHPYEVSWSQDSRWIYAGRFDGTGVIILNADTLAIVATLPTGYTRMITFNQQGTLAYVSSSNGFWLIDATTHTLIGKILNDQTFDSALTPDGKFIYVTNYEGDKVYKLETTKHTIVNTLTGFNRTREIVINRAGTRAYFASLGAGTVSEIDVTKDTVTRTIRNLTNPNGIDLSKDGSKLYVSDYQAAALYVYDTQSLVLEATISCFSNLYTVKVHPTAQQAYVSDYGNGHIAMVDLVSNKVTSKVKGFNVCQGIKPSQDGKWLAVAEQGRISIIPL